MKALLAILLFCSVSLAVRGSEIQIYAADHNTGKVILIKEDGTLLWDFPNSNGHDVQLLANGNILITPGKAQEVSPDKKVVWEIGSPTIIHAEAVQRLANGNTMIADNGAHKVVDVSPDNKIVWSFDIPGNAQMRQVRRLENGNTLICAAAANVVLEVNPAKEIVWRYEIPFPYLAQRQANGNTLISSGGANYLIEVDKDGKTVWKYGGEGAPKEEKLSWPAGFVQMKDGTIYVSEAQAARIRVISPDRKTSRFITSSALKHTATFVVFEK